VNDAGFTWLHTQNMNEDPLENTSGDIRSYYGFNNNPAVGQFVDALKTNIINGRTNRGLCVTNCEDDCVLFWITYSCCSGHLILLH
jgi:hypothetical protein